ncbi:MAG: 2-hydroxyacid dehydrogenase [Sphingobacteriia bacterium]|nr:MAG: 2-hydroxyacid dehydrogenase [Sphingobacteriia bacterium]
MKMVFFSAQPYDKTYFTQWNNQGLDLVFFEPALTEQTVELAQGAAAVCVFVNDIVNQAVLARLAALGVKVVALRCAGFNHVDLEAARALGLRVCRVPAYSPEAVAEHSLALLLTLNRKTHKAYNRVREQNFSLHGLMGQNLYGKTIGVIGTGKIGQAFCRIMLGMGCRVMAFDLVANTAMQAMGVDYQPLLEVLKADVVSLHCPLNEQTRHLINDQTLLGMKDGAVLLNTSRGGLIDTPAVIRALKKGKLGALGIDVYEQEEKLFFRDLSTDIIQDDVLQRLSGFPNVLITAHQAFFTHEALTEIAQTTLESVGALLKGQKIRTEAALLV